jgi:hypothetical protein
MTMLLSAAEGEDGAVVVLEVCLDLRPVHVGNAHVVLVLVSHVIGELMQSLA